MLSFFCGDLLYFWHSVYVLSRHHTRGKFVYLYQSFQATLAPANENILIKLNYSFINNINHVITSQVGKYLIKYLKFLRKISVVKPEPPFLC